MGSGEFIELLFYFIAMIGIAYFANKRNEKTFDSYILASRKVPWFLLGITLIGTWIGGGTLIGMAGKISKTGLAFIFVPLGVSIGFIVLGNLSKYYRKKQDAAEVTAKTIVERLSQNYGEEIRFPAFLIIVILMVFFISVQIYAGSQVIANRLNMDPILTTLIFSFLVAIYSSLGGTRGDIWTDLVQVIIIFITFIGAFISIVVKDNIGMSIQELSKNSNLLNIDNLGLAFLVGSLILPTLTIHSDGGIQQKLLVAKSEKDAKIGSWLAAGLYFIFSIILISLILLTLASPTVTAGDQIIFNIGDKLLPTPFIILLSLALLSAVLSTIDSELLLVSALVVNDFVVPRLSGYEITANEAIKYKVARWWVIICFILSLGFSFLIGDLFDLISALWVASLSCLGLPILGLFWRWLGKKMTGKFIRAQIGWSALLVVFVAVNALHSSADITMRMVSLGLGLLILNFIILILYSYIQSQKAVNV